MGLFSHSKSKLGIDIGTSSIKLVQLRRDEASFFIETYGVVEVSYKMGQKEDFDAIRETGLILKKLMDQSRVAVKKAVVSLPNSIVFVSMIELPEMSDKQLKESIQWEARRYVPLPLEEVTLSWSVLRESVPTKETQKLKVLLTAVPTTVIDNYLQMFKGAGIEPEALEIEALALIRALVGQAKNNLIIVDIGAQSTSVNLVDNGFLRVSRNMTLGGQTITKRIAENMKVSFDRAEEYKRGLGGGPNQIPPKFINPVLDAIKDEVAQLLKIYASNQGSIEKIILAGSGSQFPGLINYFSDLGPQVEIGDPLRYVSFDPNVKEHISSVAQSLSIAIGLAMRE